MGLEAFLAENVAAAENKQVVISPRFKEPFEIKAINGAEGLALRKSCYKKVKGKYGQTTTEFDAEEYQTKLVAKCTVVPDFRNAELQANWGVLGDEALIKKMLLPGEFYWLVDQIQELCGFDSDIEEDKEEIKKSTEMEMENCDTPTTVSLS